VRFLSATPVDPKRIEIVCGNASIGVDTMKMSETARVLTLGVMLAFAAFATTSAIAEDDQKEGGASKGAAKGAAAGAILPGVDA
jgi:hypothetical protein